MCYKVKNKVMITLLSAIFTEEKYLFNFLLVVCFSFTTRDIYVETILSRMVSKDPREIYGRVRS